MQEIIKIDLHKVRVVVCTFIQNFRYQNWGTRRGARVPAPGPDESSEGKGRRPPLSGNARRCARLRGTGPGGLRGAGIGAAMGGRGGC
jgi:hypothetical protein